MGEKMAVWRSKKPYTKDLLVQGLRKLGVKNGDTLIFHSAMGQAGWVCGGAVTFIEALQESVGIEGNLVMPSQTENLSDPSTWQNPPVPEEWWETIRQEMPPFHKAKTPCYRMGVIPETFRSFPDVVRSSHPLHSFVAWGSKKEWLVADHSLGHGFGEQSPLAKLYQLRTKILLLGVDNDNNTSLHLAEERAGTAKIVVRRAPVSRQKVTQWAEFEEPDYDSDRFLEIGTAYERATQYHKQRFAGAPCKLYEMRELIDFAVDYLQKKDSDPYEK